MNFILKSDRILFPEGEPRSGAIEVSHGKIKSIQPRDFFVGNSKAMDVGSSCVMAGIVDTHAHINEPGRTEWEGFRTATMSAASGGITSVIDMPLNSIPATTSLEALEVKRKSAQNQCFIDYAFWGGLVPGNLNEIQKLATAGVKGFKAFLAPSGVDEFPMVGERELREGMKLIAKTGLPLLAHAEIEAPQTSSEDPRLYSTYLHSRPSSWEVSAIRLLIQLMRETGCRVHIVHLSAADALEDIQGAKKEGLPLTVETCPHYLSLSAEDISAGATQFKCAPPIREKKNQDRLWRALEEGIIDFIVSDHSPCTPNLKSFETGDFMKAWGGISSLQFSLPVIWTEMRRRGIPLSRLSHLLCEAPADFAGLSRQKGRLLEGSDADFVIWNPEASFTLETSMIHHRHKVTPYLGRQLWGIIERTFLRGEKIYDRGEFFEPIGKAV